VKHRLTAMAVSKLTKPGRHAVGHGVYLQITGNRGRSWVFRFEREYGGKRRGRHIGLGPCALLSLAEAREKGLEYRKLLLNGIDPLDHKKALRQRALEAAARDVTFRNAPSVISRPMSRAGAMRCIGGSGARRWKRTRTR
jgi:Arm DNA-binding domain